MHDISEGSSVGKRILHDFGYFGHFLHQHTGGRAGKQHVLTHLLNSGGSLTQRELQMAAGTTAASLSEVLAKLEAEGFIERVPLESDARQRNVRLTEPGAAKAKDLEAERVRFEKDALSPLSEDEKRQLIGLLDRVAAHWREIEGRERVAVHEQ